MALRKPPRPPLAETRRQIDLLGESIAKTTDFRDRLRLSRQLAFIAGGIAIAKEPVTMEDVEAGLAALQLSRKSGATNEDLNRSVALLYKRRLDLMGAADVRIISYKKKKVAIDTATLIATGAPGELGDLRFESEAQVSHMSNGRALYVDTGSDGHFNLSARLVDSSEPVLSVFDYKKLSGATPCGHLRVTIGKIWFGAMESPAEGIELDAPNGLLKAQVFLTQTPRNSEYHLVCCPTDGIAPYLDTVPRLE